MVMTEEADPRANAAEHNVEGPPPRSRIRRRAGGDRTSRPWGHRARAERRSPSADRARRSRRACSGASRSPGDPSTAARNRTNRSSRRCHRRARRRAPFRGPSPVRSGGRKPGKNLFAIPGVEPHEVLVVPLDEDRLARHRTARMGASSRGTRRPCGWDRRRWGTPSRSASASITRGRTFAATSRKQVTARVEEEVWLKVRAELGELGLAAQAKDFAAALVASMRSTSGRGPTRPGRNGKAERFIQALLWGHVRLPCHVDEVPFRHHGQRFTRCSEDSITTTASRLERPHRPRWGW